MKLIADQQIPLVNELFADDFTVHRYPSDAITPALLRDADVLLIRSTLKVDKTLLAGSQIQYVATTTSGFDHIDTRALTELGICWSNAAGCNAQSVADYVVATIAALQDESRLAQDNLSIGIVGVGHVGRLVAHDVAKLGMKTRLCDPPRAEHDPHFQSIALEQLHDVDVLCLHTPLTTTGPHPTHHLINEDVLKHFKKGMVILNASRGDVLDPACIIRHKNDFMFCLDVFSHEPAINPEHLAVAHIATPHIAGHAIEAKWRGTEMAHQSIAQHFQLPMRKVEHYPLASPTIIRSGHETPQQHILQQYDPRKDMQAFKAMISAMDDIASAFVQYRLQYGPRHELK